MKTFSEIREAADKRSKGKPIYSKKIKGISVEIYREMNKFHTYVDGDYLDSYNSQKEAEKAGLEFINQFRG